MKNIFKSLCLGLLLAFTVISVNPIKDVNAATKTKVTYKLDKGTLTVSGKGEMPKKMTFKENKKIKKVVIKNGITSIPKYAFSDCKKLKKVVIGKGVKKIGKYAFSHTKVTSVNIPNKVKKIEPGTFAYCKKLKKVNIGKKVTEIKGFAFWNCNNIKKIEIPNSVKVIEKQAFYKCKKLEKVKLGNNVETIGNSAFQTTNIKNVKIPNSVKAMGVAAFDSDKTKINVEIPGNITVDKAHWISVCNAGKITFTTDLNIELIQHLEAEDFEVSKNDPNYTSIDGNIYTKDGKTLVRVATLKKNVRIVDGCENICTSAFLYTPLGLNWEAKLRKHIDNLFIPKTVKNIDEKSYITYESEPEKITSEERAKVQKGAVTINNIQIENKNFDVNILSKLLDKVTCNKDEVLKQLTAK